MDHQFLADIEKQLSAYESIHKTNLHEIYNQIGNLFIRIKEIILYDYFSHKESTYDHLKNFQVSMKRMMAVTSNNERKAEHDSLQFLSEIPKIRKLILHDLEAAYKRDPAAKSYEEIALTYPGLLAIMVYRISHELYKREYFLFSRLLSEHAHGLTGIDIHPGAKIGEGFFIDHGTGIVIGETAEIGQNVTLYHGVTLGAISFQNDDEGAIVKGGKRHPTIEDRVTIYAGATILGGKTVIGKDSIIGGNAWITESIPPKSKVITIAMNKISSLKEN